MLVKNCFYVAAYGHDMISAVLRRIAEHKAALEESLRGHEVPPPLSAAMKDVDRAAAREQFGSYTSYAPGVAASTSSSLLCGDGCLVNIPTYRHDFCGDGHAHNCLLSELTVLTVYYNIHTWFLMPTLC